MISHNKPYCQSFTFICFIMAFENPMCIKEFRNEEKESEKN